MQSLPERIHDAYQDVISALSADLETGSHHRNNEAHDKFVKLYPNFNEALDKLADLIDQLIESE